MLHKKVVLYKCDKTSNSQLKSQTVADYRQGELIEIKCGFEHTKNILLYFHIYK